MITISPFPATLCFQSKLDDLKLFLRSHPAIADPFYSFISSCLGLWSPGVSRKFAISPPRFLSVLLSRRDKSPTFHNPPHCSSSSQPIRNYPSLPLPRPLRARQCTTAPWSRAAHHHSPRRRRARRREPRPMAPRSRSRSVSTAARPPARVQSICRPPATWEESWPRTTLHSVRRTALLLRLLLLPPFLPPLHNG
jgi:hypothetical protein